MQVDASRLWHSHSVGEHPAFPLDPALASYRPSSSSSSSSSQLYGMSADNRSSQCIQQQRAYSDPSGHRLNSNLMNTSSPTPSSTYSTTSPHPRYDNMQRSPRFPPVRTHGVSSSQSLIRDGRASPIRQLMPPPGLYTHPSQIQDSPPSPDIRNLSSLHSQFSSMPSMPRLPPILQVEKQQVTTSATQAASASRRRNEAHFMCPVPGCGSTFTRRFNLRGHLRSHTEERPFVCEWPGCGKGFARQHDCKRHQNLHYSKAQQHVCHGCRKTFSRLDALNRHLRSEGGVECRQTQEAVMVADRLSGSPDDDWEKRTVSSVTSSQSPR